MTGYQPYKQLFYIWYQPTSCNFPFPSSASSFSDLRTQKNKRANSIYGQHTRLITNCKVEHTVTTAEHTIFSPNILYTFAEPELPNVHIDDTYSLTKGEYGIDSCQRQEIFFSFTDSRPVLGPTQLPLNGYRGPFPLR